VSRAYLRVAVLPEPHTYRRTSAVMHGNTPIDETIALIEQIQPDRQG
jgi:hypothetical protein